MWELSEGGEGKLLKALTVQLSSCVAHPLWRGPDPHLEGCHAQHIRVGQDVVNPEREKQHHSKEQHNTHTHTEKLSHSRVKVCHTRAIWYRKVQQVQPAVACRAAWPLAAAALSGAQFKVQATNGCAAL